VCHSQPFLLDMDSSQSSNSVDVLDLRILRHPAHPGSRVARCPFDDLEVSILAALYVRFLPVYLSDQSAFIRVLIDKVVKLFRVPQSTYSTANALITRPGFSDMRILLDHFDNLRVQGCIHRLSNLADEVEPRVVAGSLGIAAGPRPLFVLPKIESCLFCGLELSPRLWKARGCGSYAGFCWGYHYTSGAIQVVMFHKTCTCGTVYSLQTYTPGYKILGTVPDILFQLLSIVAQLQVLRSGDTPALLMILVSCFVQEICRLKCGTYCYLQRSNTQNGFKSIVSRLCITRS
jgi:hypothetical protein